MLILKQGYTLEEIPNKVFNVLSINSIQTKHKSIRQDSKPCSFALQYAGTWVTLHKNSGFTPEDSKEIVNNYQKLYHVSVQVTKEKLELAGKTGYIIAAFGLRVRTPLLHQVIRGLKCTPHEAEAEARTAGNAMSQSWCLLNSRAGSEFMGKVRDSEYRLDIRPCAHIHDAQYYLIRDNIDTILYTNEHLVKAVQWQEDPLITHDEVKLGGELSIFYPDWSKELTIPNEVSEQQLLSLVQKHIAT